MATDRIQKIQTLLAEKNYCDQRFRKALKRMETYSEEVDIKEHVGIFDERIIAVVRKNKQSERLLSYAQAVFDANAALLEFAPEYFNGNSNQFKEPKIIHNATEITISTDTAVPSHKIAGTLIVKRLAAFIKKHEREMLAATDKKEVETLKKKIVGLNQELGFFTENKDELFRQRGRALSDLVVFHKEYPYMDKKAIKTHVNAGGLIVVRHANCKESNIKRTEPAKRSSIYDHANGFKCSLYPSSTLYFEKNLEALRATREHSKAAKGIKD